MDIEAEVKRIDGQWRLKLNLPKWVIDDILRDMERTSTRALVCLQEFPIPSGASHWAVNNDKLPKVLAQVAFEEENVEPK